ncbi:hypothetical protein [Bacillus thermotolerans]|uniref:YtxH domain-containing protein n=1 Tax=Bacillus thermotolerans TaxID=1221996 RepID=A0A0F5IAZ0_BACTR|nr:hypothetical protein [Bacillus thermotolerans]KKB42495.1 hypothetical protein QY95_00344 [Bacillus thermotolerans]
MFGKNMNNSTNKSSGLGYMLLGAGVAAWWLSKDENRQKFDSMLGTAKEKMNNGNMGDMMSTAKEKMNNMDMNDMMNKAKEKMNNANMGDMVNTMKDKMNRGSANPSKEEFPVLKGGHPHPEDVADNKMVSEGSQFAVKYYNEEEQQQSK